MLILSPMHDLSEINGFIVLQNILLSVIYFTFKETVISLVIIMNSIIFFPISQKVIMRS